jgi:HK97 family phage major capsid protein
MPKIGASANYFWLEENEAATESQQTFEAVVMEPHTIASYTEISRQLLLQSNPDVEDVTMADQAAILGVGVDTAFLVGDGNKEPGGIMGGASANVATVNAASGNYDTLLEFQADVLSANAMVSIPNCAYLTTTALARTWGNRQRFTGTDATLWQGNLAEGTMAGFPSFSSEVMPASHILFGDFSTIMIAEWGTLALEVNPFANFKAGIVGLRAMYSLDIAVRSKQSWAFASNAS